MLMPTIVGDQPAHGNDSLRIATRHRPGSVWRPLESCHDRSRANGHAIYDSRRSWPARASRCSQRKGSSTVFECVHFVCSMRRLLRSSRHRNELSVAMNARRISHASRVPLRTSFPTWTPLRLALSWLIHVVSPIPYCLSERVACAVPGASPRAVTAGALNDFHASLKLRSHVVTQNRFGRAVGRYRARAHSTQPIACATA